ncbi:MAG: flagellar protein FlaG [Nitrospinae bacterium]|nr:flagellar protein FlaG [Nitrospinota bacterium]
MNVTKAELSFPSTAALSALPISRGEEKGEGNAGAAQPAEVKRGREERVAAAVVTEKAKRAPPPERTTRERDVQEAVRKANAALGAFDGTALKLRVDRKEKLVMIQVVKPAAKSGGEDRVIRQIPPDELLKLADKLHALQGLLFDQQV